MNTFRLLALCAAIGCAAAACASNGGGKTTGTTTSSSSNGTKTIGVSIQDLEAQFYQQMEAGMQSQAAKYGYKIIFVDANRDNSKQQSQVEDFISKRVDALVLTPYDSPAIGSAIA